MMETLIGLGLKSLLIAGVTLGLLHLTRRRSAADRSWIAHLGLVALVALPFASLALPALSVEIAAFEATNTDPAETPSAAVRTEFVEGPSGPINVPATEQAAPIVSWQAYAYAVPALALLIVTLVALLRLFGLKGRAQGLVDPVWLSALAHAQRRMGFKNGTALLTSSELSSPISWGLFRPVILLNDEALRASGEAEAIIAHELAHVARLDWAKLMLARIATAMFWFNPLAWVLAREAHQLREEAADDAVLGADIADTDYAQLLVGVARHECRGLLLGAHGISPGKGSLRRRVSRVLDTSLSRASGGRSWVAGFAAGMLVMAAPLAALTFSPTVKDKLSDQDVADAEPTTVPSNSKGATISVHAPDANGRQKLVIRSASGATISYADARDVRGMDHPLADGQRQTRTDHEPKNAIDRAIEMKAFGVTPQFIAAIERAAPQIGRLNVDDAVAMRAVGVSARYIADLTAAGFGNLDQDRLIEARTVGVTGEYVRSMIAAGVRGSLNDYVEMRALGIDTRDVSRLRGGPLSAKKLVKMKTGYWDDHKPSAEPPEPPEPPDVDAPDTDPTANRVSHPTR